MRHGAAGGDVLEEVVAFVVHEDEGGKISGLDAPDGFPARLDDFTFVDAFTYQDGGGVVSLRRTGLQISGQNLLPVPSHLLAVRRQRAPPE